MNNCYIPTINQLSNGLNPIIFVTFPGDGTIKYNWNLKYPFELFLDKIENFEDSFSLISSTKSKNFNGVKHNKYVLIQLDKDKTIKEYKSNLDGSISNNHSKNITFNNSIFIDYYYLPIMKDNILVDLIKITKDYDIRDIDSLKKLSKVYNLEKELKRFINKT